jgi:membrane protein required for colicin V production
MPVTILDGVVVVVILISAMLAMVRGFVREVLSLASWVIAAAAAYLLYKPALPFVQTYLANKNVAIIATAAVIFFIVLIIASYIAMKISDFVIDSRVGLVDRVFGFLFGAARGLLLAVIAFSFLSWILSNKQPYWVVNAQSTPMLRSLGDRLIAALPEDIEQKIQERLHGGGEDTTTTPPADAPADAPDTAPQPAMPAPTTTQPDANYGSKTRQDLNDLINNDSAPAEEPGAGTGQGKTTP